MYVEPMYIRIDHFPTVVIHIRLTRCGETLYVAESLEYLSITYLYPVVGFSYTTRTKPVALDHMGVVDSGEEALKTRSSPISNILGTDVNSPS